MRLGRQVLDRLRLQPHRDQRGIELVVDLDRDALALVLDDVVDLLDQLALVGVGAQRLVARGEQVARALGHLVLEVLLGFVQRHRHLADRRLQLADLAAGGHRQLHAVVAAADLAQRADRLAQRHRQAARQEPGQQYDGSAAAAAASQEAIKMLGTNGGGFFNANSAHPFENPNAAYAIYLQMLSIFVIPAGLTYTWPDDRIASAMAGRSWRRWRCCSSPA